MIIVSIRQLRVDHSRLLDELPFGITKNGSLKAVVISAVDYKEKFGEPEVAKEAPVLKEKKWGTRLVKEDKTKTAKAFVSSHATVGLCQHGAAFGNCKHGCKQGHENKKEDGG